MKYVLVTLLTLLPVTVLRAREKEYRPGGAKYLGVWNEFYAGDHEPELDDPLIRAGHRMTLVICEAIKHRDMRLRRYAIGALGYIGDPRAVPSLRAIVTARDEIYYMRGDALHAIYQLDRSLAKALAPRYAGDHEYLARLASSIAKDEKWLTEPTEEREPASASRHLTRRCTGRWAATCQVAEC
jgi:hypothetical protein